MSKVKNLVIVESPSKASTIEKYLGNQYQVVASKGHICDLATSGKGGLGIDVDNNFTTTYIISPSKKSVVKDLKERLKNCENVLLATDPDREGEAIAYHLAKTLNIDINDNNRVVFHEVTKPAIIEAINKPGKIDMGLVDSQETRRILDRIIGFKLSTLLQSKIKSKSAGRVQSVALKLIVDREEEINAFKPEEYWTVNADFKENKIAFTSELVKENNKKVDIKDEKHAMKIKDDCSNHPFIVSDVKNEVKSKKPKYPFITSTLQQDASTKLYFSSKKTMSIAQKLYEGINIGSGVTGLITYMRSDSNRLSDVFVNNAKEYIDKTYGKEYVGSYHQKVDKNAQDAHEAIRPTDINNNPEKIKEYLTNDEYKLYRMIYYRTLACLMSELKYNSSTIKLVNGVYEFNTTGKTLLFDGYLKAYGDYETNEDKELPQLAVNDSLEAVLIDCKQHFTEPPLRYSEARLIKTMEEDGIGRPSTYATIIETIIEREYVTLEKSTESSKTKVFVPTAQGILTTKKLDEYFNKFINVTYTADMEKQLDEIADGKLDKLKSLNEFYEPFMETLEYAKANMEKIQPEKTGEKCPQCGADLVIRKGKYGEFIACSNYPQCKYVKQEEQEEEDYGTCPQCGNKLAVKHGRFGKFIACSNYPECKYIVKKEKPKAEETGEMCPQCGKPLVKRLSRYGKEFIGCSNYPKCHYIKKDESKALKKKINED